MANSNVTGRFQWPIPSWNSDWQKWQQMFGSFAHGVDAAVFGILEHITLLARSLPSEVLIDPGTKVFSQNAAAVFVSRTLHTQISVGPTNLTLIPGAIVGATLQPGAVGPQQVAWALYDGSTPIDPSIVTFGVVGSDYTIRWYNGARLPLGTPMALFDFPGTGGGDFQEGHNELITTTRTVSPVDNRVMLETYIAGSGNGPITAEIDQALFSLATDEGWQCTFKVGVNHDGLAVPMVVACTTDELSVGDALNITSLTCNQVGGLVTVRYAYADSIRGRFMVMGGQGTWVDSLGGSHVFGAISALSGVINPNGVVSGALGNSYYQTGVGVFWINIDGGTGWIVQ